MSEIKPLQLQELRQMIKEGELSQDFKDSYLQSAAVNGWIEEMKSLIKDGAKEYYPALYGASIGNKVEAAKLLIEYGRFKEEQYKSVIKFISEYYGDNTEILNFLRKQIKSVEETTRVVEKQTEEGQKVVTISKGTKQTTRLDHTVPSWMTSEE